jgi:predicted component of type VI protein secretion system
MTGLSRHSVVEDIATLLNERRGARTERRAAYLALARAILADEPEAPASASALVLHAHVASAAPVTTAA